MCAEADDAEQAIRAAKREQPDLCLIGDHIAGDGLAAIRGVSRAAPGCAVVVLAQAHDADYLLSAFAPAPSDTSPERSTPSA